MSRSAQPFTQSVKGAVKAGLNVQRFEVDRDGTIVVFTGKPPKFADVDDATALIG